MFKPLGLFTARCPDPTCRRPSCFFKHGQPSTSRNPSVGDVNGVKASPIKRKSSAEVVRPALKQESSSRDGRSSESFPSTKRDGEGIKRVEQVLKKPKVEARGAGSPMDAVKGAKGVGTSRAVAKPSSSVPTTKAALPPAPAKPRIGSSSIDLSQPPIIPAGAKPVQPISDRRRAIATLFQQFVKLYSAVLPLAPDLAHRSSLAQEAEISASSPNLRAYKSAMHHAAVAVSRRPPPTSLDHPSIGTNKESRAAHDAAEKAKASKPTRSRVEGYCLAPSEFKEWAYPDPLDPNLCQAGGEEPDAEGTDQVCSRCKVPFTVSSKDLEGRMGECKFHYGKIAPERIEGKRKWIYGCCKRERGEVGCEEGVHVFSEREDDEKLKRRVGFRTVRQVIEGKEGPRGWVDVVAMDCEMIYTTGGSSLARVTIVDEEGATLLDELVRPKVAVLDLNSRFSGVNPGDLDAALMDLEAVRQAACMFIGPDTIIVGHGLENDLRALRLVHDKVIDTAILFPHDKGKPYRRALRDIVREKLGYFIQDRTSDLGHSSAEDAKATLECLKWKVRTDAE